MMDVSLMNAASGNKPRRNLKSRLVPLIGYGISAACLVWLYWGFDWKTELRRFAAADWRWVTLAVVVDLAVYVIQGWRWRLLLTPVAQPSFARSVQAVFIGLFANEVLPFRSGELIRCYVLAKWTRIPFSVTLSSAVIERLFDGIWLIGGFFLIGPFVDLPGYIREGGRIFGIVLLAAAILLGVAIFWKQHAHAAVSASRWSEALFHVVEGLHAMGRSASFYAAAAVSFLYLGFQVVPIYALMQGWGLDLPLGAAVVVLVILRMGTILPQAPGNIRAFQFFTVLGLTLFGVEKATATGFATLVFVVVTVPLWLGGMVAVALTGARIRDLQRDARSSLEPATVPPRTGTRH